MALTGAEKQKRHRERTRRRERVYHVAIDKWTVERLIEKRLIESDAVFSDERIAEVVADVVRRVAKSSKFP